MMDANKKIEDIAVISPISPGKWVAAIHDTICCVWWNQVDSRKVENFISTGLFDYGFDAFNNVILNDASSNFNQNYISLPLESFKYDLNKVLSFNSMNFDEFGSNAPSVTSIISSDRNSSMSQQNADDILKENAELKHHLDSLIKQLEQNNNTNDNDANKVAAKQIIVELRTQLGQGSQFSTDFPYLPI